MRGKRLYWLKLKDNFFDDPKIKKLRRMAGGDTYTIIYQKIMLLSLKTNGVIHYEGIEDDLAAEIALIIDEDETNVKATLLFMQSMNLIEEIGEEEFLLPHVQHLIGSESDSAERVRKHRERKALSGRKNHGGSLHCNAGVTDMKRTCNENVTPENKRVREKREEKEKKVQKKESRSSSLQDAVEFSEQGGFAYRLNQESYGGWIDYRRSRRKPVSKEAMKRQVKMLCGYPPDVQAEIIETSIANDYQGIFPPKGRNVTTGKSPPRGSGIPSAEDFRRVMESVGTVRGADGNVIDVEVE